MPYITNQHINACLAKNTHIQYTNIHTNNTHAYLDNIGPGLIGTHKNACLANTHTHTYNKHTYTQTTHIHTLITSGLVSSARTKMLLAAATGREDAKVETSDTILAVLFLGVTDAAGFLTADELGNMWLWYECLDVC